AQFLTRAQHPGLYQHLMNEYKEACAEFDQVYQVWSEQAAQQINSDENTAIRQKLLEMNGVVSPLEEAALGIRVQPKTNYVGSKWWTGTRLSQSVPKSWVTSSSWGGLTPPESTVQTEKTKYIQKMVNQYRDMIQASIDRIQLNRMALQPTHDLVSKILERNSNIMLQGVIGPQILVPKTLGTPYLVAPKNLNLLLTNVFYDAYQLGLIQIRFTYEIVDTLFVVKGEWCDNKTSEWMVFTQKNYAYQSLFYEDSEAILGFWYGGNMPLDTNTGDHTHYNFGFSGNAPTHGCNRWNDYIYTPTYQNRTAALDIDIYSLPEQVLTELHVTQEKQIQRLIDDWFPQLSIRLATKCLRDMDNSTTPLAKALLKMDRTIHLMQAYLNVLAFGHQDNELRVAMQDAFHLALFDSHAMRACLTEPTRGIKEFNQRRPSTAVINQLEERVSFAVSQLPVPGLMTPFANGVRVLYEVLRDRTHAQRLPNLNARIQILDGYMATMRGNIENVFRNSGDVVYSEALRTAMQYHGNNCAKLSGQLEMVQQSEHEDLMRLMENQRVLLGKLTLLNEMVYRVSALVQKKMLSQDILEHLAAQQTSLYEAYNHIEDEIADMI
ncbi:MAG: hypothetical protein EBY22_12985, partial [Gammaproteobacteria bacterium]|nr:hypothetical protein [Gammaproteobacteria bacterium]